MTRVPAVQYSQQYDTSAGWYADPYEPTGLRFWDGISWTVWSTSGAVEGYQPPRQLPATPRRRRSPLLGFVLALFLGVLALPYALPLPTWARLLLAAAMAVVLGWWLLLVVPLTWPIAVVAVPLLTALLNPPR